jgi:hypothetical protein
MIFKQQKLNKMYELATVPHVNLWLIHSHIVTLEILCWMCTVLTLKFLESPLDKISIEILPIMYFLRKKKYRYSVLQCLTPVNFTPLYNPLNCKRYCLSLWSTEIVRIMFMSTNWCTYLLVPESTKIYLKSH